MLNLNSPINSQSTQIKFCLHCGEGNYQDIGQCVSCRRTDFVSEEEFEKERNVGKQQMIIGSLFSLAWLAFLILWLNTNVDSSMPRFGTAPFFILLGLFIAIDGVYKYKYGRRKMIWGIAITACLMIIVVMGFYYD